MSDPQIPYTPPAEPAAPAVAEPATPSEPVDYSTHPVWGKAIEAIPTILRGPLVETIQSSEREAQKAIEAARNTGVPEDWRALAEEAQQLGVSTDDLARAYQGQNALAELMQSDPDAFVSELTSQVNALVDSGQLTRAEGRQVIAQGQAAAGEVTDPLLTDEQREIAELKAWKAQQEQAQQTAAQQRQQEAERQRIAQEEEQASNQYFDAFDREMEAAGFLARNGATGRLDSTIPVQTLQLIARTGAELRDANPRLPYDQAIKQATEQVRTMIEGVGGKLGPAPRPQVPVVGASNAVPTNQVAEPAGGPRSMKDRMEAALAEATRQAGLAG